MVTDSSISLWLELETRCNLSCAFCYNYWKDGVSQKPEPVSHEVWMMCLENLVTNQPCGMIALSGGEPLLHPRLLEIAAFARQHTSVLSLHTNGVLLDEAMLTELKRVGVDTYHLPLLAAQEVLHDTLSGAKCWKLTLERLAYLREEGLQVVPVFVACKQNLQEISGVLRIINWLKLEHLMVNKVVFSGRARLNAAMLEVDEAAFQEWLRTLNQEAATYGVNIILGTPVAMPSTARKQLGQIKFASCPVEANQRFFVMDSMADIRTCSSESNAIGNLSRASFQHIRQQYRQTALSRSEVDGIRACEFRCCG